MFEMIGKYNKAKVYASTVEQTAYSQIQNLLNQKFSEGSEIAIMPDCHAGAGCVIGFTQTIVDKVVPNLVGVDIGCGMLVCEIDGNLNLEQLDEVIHNKIPSGMKHRDSKHKFADIPNIQDIVAPVKVDELRLSIGTLGGGNHFIEVDVDDEGKKYIVIHSGSRHLGIEVAKYWQDKAVKYHTNNTDLRNKVIARCKKEGCEKDIQRELSLIETVHIPSELAYLEGEDMKNYLHDMDIAQRYANVNREAMLDVILSNMDIIPVAKFSTIHNYIDLRRNILRKGAISLDENELAIIPMNMRDGSLIVKGKGNPEWNFSGPHGAGRLMSRSKAKESISLVEFEDSMKGIFTTCVNTSTIDESPMAYKPMDEIIENIEPAADIINIIKPIYNFKASE